MNIRIGNGYDIHRLVTGRPLILGGVEIAHTVGLLGHSDADVLTHAITQNTCCITTIIATIHLDYV